MDAEHPEEPVDQATPAPAEENTSVDCAPDVDGAPTTDSAAGEAPKPENPFAVKVSADLVRSIMAMGFSETASKKAVMCGCIDVNTALQWIDMHKDQQELLEAPIEEEVIMVEKRILTAEEKAAKVEEMKAKIASKKVADAEAEKQRALAAELSRIEMGKHMLEAKEQREALERQRAYEERRKQKIEDARAREKLRVQLAVDKLVRSGVNAEEAQARVEKEFAERKKQEEEEAAKKRAEPAPTAAETHASHAKEWRLNVPGSTPSAAEDNIDLPAPTLEGFSSLVQTVKASHSNAEQVAACFNTIKTIFSNILADPLNPKMRSIRTSTNVFTNKVMPVRFAAALLRLGGFEKKDDTYAMTTVVVRRLQYGVTALNAA